LFTIAGAGFGLYGYLPVLVEKFGQPVLLPRRYQPTLSARPELKPYENAIEWVNDTDTALRRATGVVIATPPAAQLDIVARSLRIAGIDAVFLEKPIAITPAQGIELLDRLRRSGKRYRVGYTLLHTEWAARLTKAAVSRAQQVTITWEFLAHHFRHQLANWKRDSASGGGVVRFYAIHVLALLAHHGYRHVSESVVSGASAEQPERWSAIFAEPALPECRVVVDSRSQVSGFKVVVSGALGTERLVDLTEPFELEQPIADKPGLDRRTGAVARLLDSLGSDDEGYYDLYDESARLWQSVEEVTQFLPA
jgi:predicted dehydrogenase